MKRLAASVVIAVLVLVPAQAASADLLDLGGGDLTAGVFPSDQFSTLNSSGHSFAVGGGTTTTTKFAFSAHNGPNGPSGYLVMESTLVSKTQGHVICYQPSIHPMPGPNTTTFGIKIEKGSASPLFPLLYVEVTDSGQPGGAGDHLLIERSAFPCHPEVLAGGGFVTQGNIVVKN